MLYVAIKLIQRELKYLTTNNKAMQCMNNYFLLNINNHVEIQKQKTLSK